MGKLPMLKSEEVLAALSKAGFQRVRQVGSHILLKHTDGRAVTVPWHGQTDIGRGLLRKILRDVEMSLEEFLTLL